LLEEQKKNSSKYFTKKKIHVLSRYEKIKPTEQYDILKGCIFQDITACTPLEVIVISEDTLTSIFGLKISQARNQREEGMKFATYSISLLS
jgi:hypothetical protein